MGGGGGGGEVPAAYDSKTIKDNEMKLGEVVKDHWLINLVWFNSRIMSSLRHNDVNCQNFEFSPIKEEKFIGVSEFKKWQINRTK